MGPAALAGIGTGVVMFAVMARPGVLPSGQVGRCPVTEWRCQDMTSVSLMPAK
jgi:hypothetical protein